MDALQKIDNIINELEELDDLHPVDIQDYYKYTEPCREMLLELYCDIKDRLQKEDEEEDEEEDKDETEVIDYELYRLSQNIRDLD